MSKLGRFLNAIDRGAWLRFFAALIGLAFAFGSALLSTVLHESGEGVQSAIAASIALLAAGAVAIYTVPYLAKRVAVRSLRQTFDYDVTREGIGYLTFVLVIGIAALNTGNNLLFIIVSAMLGAVLVSGVLSAAMLRQLQLDASLPVHVFARQAAMARLHLTNLRKLPVFSIHVVPPRPKDARRFRWECGTFIFPPNAPPQARWISLPDRRLRILDLPPNANAIFQGSIYFPFLASRGAAYADLELNFPRRGRYTQEGFGLSTRFPFSFLRKTLKVPLERELIAYPSVEQTDEFLAVLPMITGEFEAFVRGRGYDLYRIREHMPGDSARHVDWKATAKSGALKVREFTREDERRLRVVFDDPPAGRLTEEKYERGIGLAASLAWYFATTDAQMTFLAGREAFLPDAGIYDFLRYLALAEPKGSGSLLQSLPKTSDYNLILTSEPRGSVPTELWASSYIVFL